MLDFIDTTTDKVLAGAIALLLLWFFVNTLAYLAILRSGRSARNGAGPLFLALILGVILWVIQ